MPRGEHFRKVTDDQIVSVFDRDDLDRRLLSPEEIAGKLNAHELDGDEITAEAVRQRMHKIERLETEEIGGAVLWKKKGAQVWATSGGSWIRPFIYGIAGSSVTVTLAFAVLTLAAMTEVVNLSPWIGIGFMTMGLLTLISLTAVVNTRIPEKIEYRTQNSSSRFASFTRRVMSR